ncbi:MAG TPA: hypothetical protein VEC35_01145 [Noviherbaspirillum sp.]|nr:hypothetical protein [Noviherbaspirillum sp.]
MKTKVLDTSIGAWKRMKCDALKTQNDRVEAIVRASDGDMSLGEIKMIYRQLFQRDVPEGKKIEANVVSRIVNDLIAAKRLVRKEVTRPCKFTNEPIHPVQIREAQPSLLEI